MACTDIDDGYAVQRPENQERQWYKLQSKSEGRGGSISHLEYHQSERVNFNVLSLLFYSDLQQTGGGLTTLRKAICFP